MDISEDYFDEPKLETEDYEDFSGYQDIDYTLSYQQDYLQELN